MLNVLHLSHTDINFDSRILKEMNSLRESNHQLKIYGIGVQLDEDTTKSSMASNLEIYSFKLYSRTLTFLPRVIRHTLTMIELVCRFFVKAILLRPAVVHCHDTIVLPLGVLVKIFSGSKLIYDAHELESNRNGLTKFLGSLTLLTERFLWFFVDALIVVSPSIMRWYEKKLGHKNHEIILNSPMIESGKSITDRKYLRKLYSIQDDAIIFLYIGILGKGRGIDLIIEAFNRSDINSHVVFLGYGELKDKLIGLSEECNNIHVHDAVPHDRVVPVAQSADIGLCLIQNISLSDYYCLPNKLFEYCFAEIPVLASNFPDISNIVTQYNLGKCSELDSESVHNVIKEFEAMTELPEINADQLYELSWGAQEDKLIKLYDILISVPNK